MPKAWFKAGSFNFTMWAGWFGGAAPPTPLFPDFKLSSAFEPCLRLIDSIAWLHQTESTLLLVPRRFLCSSYRVKACPPRLERLPLGKAISPSSGRGDRATAAPAALGLPESCPAGSLAGNGDAVDLGVLGAGDEL